MLKALLALSLITLSGRASSYDVTLAWSHDQGTNVNFKVFVAPGTNAFSLNQTVSGALQARLTGLPVNTTNRFYVTAVNSSGLESAPSAVLTNFVAIPNPPFSLTLSSTNINLTVP